MKIERCVEHALAITILDGCLLHISQVKACLLELDKPSDRNKRLRLDTAIAAIKEVREGLVGSVKE